MGSGRLEIPAAMRGGSKGLVFLFLAAAVAVAPWVFGQEKKPEKGVVLRKTSGGVRFVIDTKLAPDLTEWARDEVMPDMVEWYPRIVEELSARHRPREVELVFEPDMGGIAAGTLGARIGCNALWMRQNLYEAKGAIVHEMVHVVQGYHRPAADGKPIPSWVVEGIADYVRWQFYEPERGNPLAGAGNASPGEYDAGYRASADFLKWLVDSYDREIVRKLNDACRDGKYSDRIWQTLLGKTAPELGAEWQRQQKQGRGVMGAVGTP